MNTILDMFNLNHTLAKEYILRFPFPWEAIAGIRNFIIDTGSSLGNDYHEISPQVWVHETAIIAPSAYIGAPCIIGPKTEVRHCAFIRESVLIGSECIIGNSVELKNVILFDQVQVNHFNYVGDSILGFRVHFGAGASTSNVRQDKNNIRVTLNNTVYATDMNKLGGILGDDVEVGCNSVLNPGVIIGKNTNIYPLSCVRKNIPQNCIHKNNGEVITKS